MHKWKVLIAAIILVVVFGSSPLFIRASSDIDIRTILKEEEDDVSILFFDLPEGESALFHTNDEFTVLIGTGSEASFDELSERLTRLGITVINQLILPKLEDTYMGGVSRLLDERKVEQIIVPDQGLKWFSESYQEYKIDIISWEEEGLYQPHPALQFSVMKSTSSMMPALNLDVDIGCGHRLFLANEASLELEKEWMTKDLSTVNVLKVAEYGTEKGTGEDFLVSSDPEVAVIFNLHDHTVSASVRERLQETWIDTYETKQHGTILIKVNETDYELLTIRF
ncbi:putative hydrolase (metallo-beta-lactamase superfamily) protein [Alkalihalophilus pseudofirmus OF4]|uniref:Hydrolase (Metallo-beta-lactamase superfamily) protein n=2 Tax=Alkalihalophilus pseudofirmus TaxID=79885 RepID=D3G0L2_ALKPO|nr:MULTISPECIES: hypothetical protein [Alkalihalophilus]ADC51174.1 putative hydrolase (metallo-beta-lactamase superfamily) protein [Alkalihalophilus pseudofirmus OF4]MDV2884365.1 hypothetical protein [Alkalihalophilus pseudofirmus]MED1601543.1 hypothetical protein [Alkalihalophilus marmarensis]WEG18382.1 hypothetical protein PQ478_07835 [Alkalihalophilus pseudofirmus]